MSFWFSGSYLVPLIFCFIMVSLVLGLNKGFLWVYICQVFVPFCVLAKFVPGRYFISSPSWLPLSNNEYWNQSGGSDCFPYLLLHLVPRSIGRPGWNFPELTKNSRPVESLAMVTLQKLWDQGLLKVERGGLCLFLGEECCFYINQSSTIQDTAKRLADQASQIRQWQLGSGSITWGYMS
jgi:hypothetical protein